LITESQLPAGISRHVDATEKQSSVAGNGAVPGQLILHDRVILLVDHVVHAVAVNEQIFLKKPLLLSYHPFGSPFTSGYLRNYHGMSEVIRRILRYVQQFPLLRHHHDEAGHCLENVPRETCILEGSLVENNDKGT